MEPGGRMIPEAFEIPNAQTIRAMAGHPEGRKG
jgi:hypothetical protein